jgi:DNA-binding CsgD family transcriptional regulator/tetratricopeptide (TPR) repeat protein
MFVGRTRELGELERVLDAAQAGRGATVLVAGEAGIGKTRLASKFAARARDRGFAVLVGRSIDLVGTELPYQPFVEALGELPREAGSQLRVFKTALALLAERAEPVLLVLEDLHWADTSTLDLTVFLAHNLADQQVVLLGTYRDSLGRFVESVRRSEAALTLELGPLAHEELIALLADAPGASAIATRSGGNPFFAEELLAAGGELPGSLRDVLLQRVSGLDQTPLRMIAAAGREIGPSLLRPADRESLRQAVDHGVLVADQAAGTFRFRHALLAEAVYTTILPGEREELHGRLAVELARSGAAAAELAPHWAAAGRSEEAFAASVTAAGEAEAVFGLAEAHAHLERALALWHAVPDPAAIAGCDLAELCTRTAELASEVGGAARAVELGRRAIDLVGAGDPRRAAILHVRLGEYLVERGSNHSALAALERAVALVPPEPPSPEHAYALGSLAGGLMVGWRYTESLPIAEAALALARRVGAREAEVRALTVLGGDLAYLGSAEDGVAHFRQALQLAEEIGDRIGLDRAYVNFTDALTMLGRLRESVRLGQSGLEVLRRHGIHSPLLISNLIEALLALGDWDEAERLSAAALRGITSSFESWVLILRAEVETGRGEFDAARAHLEAARDTLREDRVLGLYDAHVADLALCERRWADADAAVQEGLAQARQGESAQVRVQLCAQGLRAQAELAALARARQHAAAAADRITRATVLLATARHAAAEGTAVTPNVAGWLALCEVEYERTRAAARPDLWSGAAETWERLERLPLAAYCRWRQAEALVAAGAPRAEVTVPLREAHAVATRLRAAPLLRELDLLATRARLDPTPLPEPSAGDAILGLTPRETEVLALVAHGLTNREIADELVISVKTASVHVSHILRKLDAPNRLEAAAIAHRLAPP